MIHFFDTDVAKEYGVNAAIILQNLGYWIKKNEANGANYFDGNYWTFNSRRAYKELFPYMSERQITTAFEKLIEAELIITGNYNQSSYDRTLWYALTKKGKCILHFDIMDNVKTSNGLCQNVEPIPNINTDNKPDYKTHIKGESEKNIKNENIFEDYCKENSDLLNAFNEFEKMRKQIKKPMTDKAKKMLITEIEKISKEPETQIEILNQSILHCWQSVYPLKQSDNRHPNPDDYDIKYLLE